MQQSIDAVLRAWRENGGSCNNKLKLLLTAQSCMLTAYEIRLFLEGKDILLPKSHADKALGKHLLNLLELSGVAQLHLGAVNRDRRNFFRDILFSVSGLWAILLEICTKPGPKLLRASAKTNQYKWNLFDIRYFKLWHGLEVCKQSSQWSVLVSLAAFKVHSARSRCVFYCLSLSQACLS